MAYTNETTHYGIPLPKGSDLTTPMDYNESAQNIDTDLFASKTDSTSALQKANQLQQDLATTNDNVTAVESRVTTLEGTSVTQERAILQNTQDIADVRGDALDMICAVDEGTAQVATISVSKGNYFRYNDVLYMATADIAVGDTIVPNTNCRATNVATELSAVDISDSITADVTVSQVINKTFHRIGRLVVGTFAVEINTELSNNSAIFGGMPTPSAGAFERIQLVSTYSGDSLPIVFKIENNYMAASYPKAGTTGNGGQIMGTVCYITE